MLGAVEAASEAAGKEAWPGDGIVEEVIAQSDCFCHETFQCRLCSNGGKFSLTASTRMIGS